MSDAGSKRKYQSPRQQQRQSAILAAAREMLEEAGYAGVTIRGLAVKAGVAQATLYNIYGSKDDLILAAVDDLFVSLEAEVEDAALPPGVDQILARAQVAGTQIQKTPRYAEAMSRSLAGVQAGDPLVQALYLRALPFLIDNLAAVKADGGMENSVDIELLARHMVGQQWGVTWLWIMGVVAIEDVVTERIRSDIMALMGVARGATRKRLQRQLEGLG